MNSKNKRASIFIYVLILINITLIIGYVVFNNTYILNNNINIGKNSEEVFLKLSDKANINIEAVRQYNSNGGGFADFLSCPTNITMSGTTFSGTNITSEMNYDFGTVYCIFTYSGSTGRIYFDENTQDFTNVYYEGELRNIVNTAFYTGSVIPNALISATASDYKDDNEQPPKSLDNNMSTHFRSDKKDYTWITYDLGSTKKLSEFVIYKGANLGTDYWNNGIVYFKGATNNTLKTVTLTGVRSLSTITIPLSYATYADFDEVRYIKVMSNHTDIFLNIKEIKVTELVPTGSDNWSADSIFTDSDNTFFSFDSSGINGVDYIDDNMNSDNYRSTSTGSTGYPGDFFDDDIVPRTTIFGNVPPNTDEYLNVFWNNYITNNMVNDNVYNNDNPLNIAKISEVTEGYLFFDLFSKTEASLDYDLKIIEFDEDLFKDKYTLLPINVFETKNLSGNYGYLQLNGNTLSLSKYKTGNEFKFDLKNKDYSIYFTNSLDTNMAVRITGEEKPVSGNITDSGRKIYINPIDDSKTNIIETITNHIIIGGEKNFIGENFKVVGSK